MPEIHIMSKENDQKQRDEISLTRTFTSDLKGRQSVRATFRLTQGCIAAISIIANQMGIKQKSLFDYLAEDKKILESIAQEIKNMTLDMHNRIPKTFVINRKSMSLIDEISKNLNVTKDALVELSIQRLFPVIHGEREKHENRKAFLVEINRHYQEGEKILYSIRKQLGDDDPIIKEYEMVMSGYETSKNNMEAFIERSKGIEKFDSNEEST
jgi:hypothetical protein